MKKMLTMVTDTEKNIFNLFFIAVSMFQHFRCQISNRPARYNFFNFHVTTEKIITDFT